MIFRVYGIGVFVFRKVLQNENFDLLYYIAITMGTYFVEFSILLQAYKV